MPANRISRCDRSSRCPLRTRGTPHPAVTLIGDAAHLLPPSAGQGVNQAMLDAVELAEAIAQHADLETAVLAYEQSTFVRVQPRALLAAKGLDSITGPNAPASSLAYFRQFQPAQPVGGSR